jgi:hypothetical protein
MTGLLPDELLAAGAACGRLLKQRGETVAVAALDLLASELTT